MARPKKNKNKDIEEDIDIEELDLNEFGITENDYLDFSSINQKANLKKLKRRLRNITECMSVTENTLMQIIYLLDNIGISNKISKENKLKAIELVKNFDDSLIDIVWNLDNIIEDSMEGDLFVADCDLAEKKIIDIVNITKEIETLFTDVKVVETFDSKLLKASNNIMGIIEIVKQMQFLFKQIKNIEKEL